MFGLSFLQVFLIAWLVDTLAPTFGGQKDSLAALKVTAYSLTPGWIAAVLNVIPILGVLGILAALYGLYLLYLGLPVLMRNPKEKSIGYTVVLVICAIVLSALVTMLSACAVAGLGFLGFGGIGAMTATAGRPNRSRPTPTLRPCSRISSAANQTPIATASIRRCRRSKK